MPFTDVIERDGFAEINIPALVHRIAEQGAVLRAHESFTAHLGIGDVEIRCFPNATRVRIYGQGPTHDLDQEYEEVYITVEPRAYSLQAALARYLVPRLTRTEEDA